MKRENKHGKRVEIRKMKKQYVIMIRGWKTGKIWTIRIHEGTFITGDAEINSSENHN